MKQIIKTMEELSSAIGVSRPTLSKYFHDPSSIRQTSRDKIETALKDIDYVPNFFAMNMNRKTTRLVGVIIPHMNDLFYTSLVEAIERRAMEKDFTIITQSSHGSRELECRAIENFRSMNADGVIIAPIGIDSDEAVLAKLNRQLPLVLIDSKIPQASEEFTFVGTDNQQSITLMVDYLCRSGAAPVFLGMPKVNNNSTERAAIYKSRMQALGHKPVFLTPHDKNETWNFEAYAYELMSAYFGKGKYINSTVLCANDRLAMGVLRAANEANLFGKNDDEKNNFRVAGHDNHPLSSYMWPSLTTASQNATQIGSAAFDMVLSKNQARKDQIDKPQSLLYEAQLILRNSA